MLPEPTFNSVLMLGAILLATGAGGLFVRRSATGRMLSLMLALNAVSLVLVAGDRYFGTSTGRLTAALVLFLGLACAAVVVVAVTARGARDSERE
ncbi:MAG: hypothetical protein DIU54_008150 [Acidobacteriota bacterium]|jgi:NADH:ubiquinone oxidoreductase subunit K|nr:MAG: hypothetical protein DIU54_12805 [Acidobacteriota bacterium]